jgi:hypothetical protein
MTLREKFLFKFMPLLYAIKAVFFMRSDYTGISFIDTYLY